MEKVEKETKCRDASYGSVYVMIHSFFSDVIKIGCTRIDPNEHAIALSAKTPGDYTVVYSLKCMHPCRIKKQIREYLNAEEYAGGFYQVPAEVAENLLKRETLRIPTFNAG